VCLELPHVVPKVVCIRLQGVPASKVRGKPKTQTLGGTHCGEGQHPLVRPWPLNVVEHTVTWSNLKQPSRHTVRVGEPIEWRWTSMTLHSNPLVQPCTEGTKAPGHARTLHTLSWPHMKWTLSENTWSMAEIMSPTTNVDPWLEELQGAGGLEETGETEGSWGDRVGSWGDWPIGRGDGETGRDGMTGRMYIECTETPNKRKTPPVTCSSGGGWSDVLYLREDYGTGTASRRSQNEPWESRDRESRDCGETDRRVVDRRLLREQSTRSIHQWYYQRTQLGNSLLSPQT
jgi:hypothetical protein